MSLSRVRSTTRQVVQQQTESVDGQRDKTVTSRLYGILVTYRRQHILASTMMAILDQPAHLFRLYVVDNEDSPDTERIVHDMASRYSMTEIVYIRSEENGGPAGSWKACVDVHLPWPQYMEQRTAPGRTGRLARRVDRRRQILHRYEGRSAPDHMPR